MTPSSNGYQTNLFGNDLLQQLDPQDSLLVLAAAIPWKTFELEFTRHYVQGFGRPSKPIRLMVGLLIEAIGKFECRTGCGGIQTQPLLPSFLRADRVQFEATV